MKRVIVGTEAVPVSKVKTTFGLKQINKSTPPWTKTVFRIVLYTATALTLVTQIVTEIPEDIKTMVAKYSLESVALVHALSKLFGVKIDDGK